MYVYIYIYILSLIFIKNLLFSAIFIYKLFNLQDYYIDYYIERMSRLRGNGKTNETSNIEETANDDHTRQLRSTTHIDKVCKELFKVYLTECQKTRGLIKQENEQTRNLLKELITTVKDTSSQTRISRLGNINNDCKQVRCVPL